MKKRQYFRPKKKVKLRKHWCVHCDGGLLQVGSVGARTVVLLR